MTYKPQAINLTGIRDRWVKLLTHTQNGLAPAYRYILKDETEARWVCNSLHRVCDRDTRFRFVIFRKRNEVYVVKSDILQDIVITGVR